MARSILETRTCPICGESYKTTKRHGGKKTCGRETCINKQKTRAMIAANRKPKIKVACAHCGEILFRFPSRVDGRKHFCNQRCKAEYQARQGTVWLKCEICEGPYPVARYFAEIKDSRRSRYCSNKCKAIARSRRMMGEGNPNWQPKITLTCVTCDKKFDTTPYWAEKGKPCCGRPCSNEHRSKTYRREKHWLWKGGRIHDYGPDWLKIAARARKRDGYTCQDCSLKHKGRPALHVHHIVSLREFDGDYEAANQLSNLLTLCPDCHVKQR